MEKQLLYINDSKLRAGFIVLQDITDKLNEIFGANIMVQPSYFYSEVLLEDGTTAYAFPTITNEWDKTAFPLTRLVTYNDIFVGVKKQVAVDNRATTDSALIEWQTYFNKLIFTAANTTNPAHIQAIFTALYNYQVGSRTFIQNQLTRSELWQPRTQQSSANNWPEYDGSNIPEQVPYIVISGKSTNYLRYLLQQKNFQGGAIAGHGVNVLSWYMQGFTLQNGSGFLRFYTGDEDVNLYYAKYELANQGKARDKWQPIPADDAFANME